MPRLREKRKYKRLSAYHLVKYRLLSDQPKDADFMLASVKDIGAGGVCLESDSLLTVSALVELKINLPSFSLPVFALAKVVRVKPGNRAGLFEYGLQFLKIDESAQAAIDIQATSSQNKLPKTAGLFSKLIALFKK